jgi:hypothetical protein
MSAAGCSCSLGSSADTTVATCLPTADEAELVLSRLGGLERSIGGCGGQLDVLTRDPRLTLASPVLGPLGHVQVDESVDLTAPYT